MTPPLVLEFDVALMAPPQRAFSAITEGRHLERWFCDACESEPHEDGRLTMRWHRANATRWPYEATWIAFEPPVRCACRGGHQGYPNRDAGLIEFSLEPRDGTTRLRVRHTLPATDEYAPIADEYRAAWPRALQRLASYLQPAM